MENSTSSLGEWCGIHTAAAHLGLSESFLRKLVRQRRVPFARVGSKVLRFRTRELDKWLASSDNESSISKHEGR